ncbi:hypothetical protein PAEPH01_2584 [Pancytospora epiphaga]|nr:hypothetical protein PAEPH01_2584 [Pancytospora epiphaga]
MDAFRSVEDAPKNQKDKKAKRYNESEIIRTFLGSSEGVSFLAGARDVMCRESGMGAARSSEMKERIENLIDFYTSWTNNFPVRKNLKVSKYEFLKFVENFCSKSDINQNFSEQLME